MMTRNMALLDAAGAALVAEALRTNSTLTALRFNAAGLCRDMAAAGALLGALVGHPSLRVLELRHENVADRAALGAALAELVAADAPALTKLDVTWILLRVDGLAPLVEALPRNRHLRELSMRHNHMTPKFARERLLPAVRANTSLQLLMCSEDNGSAWPAVREAEELVNRRRLQHSSS